MHHINISSGKAIFKDILMKDICPYAETCPIFKGILSDMVVTTKVFKATYCEAGIEGRTQCKRFQCKNKFGKVPDTLLPNSILSIDEIAKENNWILV